MYLPEHIINEYKARTKESKARFDAASKRIPGGVNSNVKYFEPYPIFMKKAMGSKITDVDDNEYIDYCMAFGPIILGHGHPKIKEAIDRQLEEMGTGVFGTPSPIEEEMSAKLQHYIPSMERIRFTNSGLEATQHAIRTCIGYTGKEKVLKFEGHYHGSYDYVLTSSYPKKDFGEESNPVAVKQSASTLASDMDEIVISTFNDADDTVRIIREHAHELAAVIMEPVPRGYLVPDIEFLKAVRNVTKELDIPLIFDEVMSCFRVGLYSAQSHLGILPDITCLGKITGGGLPMGAFGGRHDIMAVCDPTPQGVPEKYVPHGGTFNGCPTVMAAGMAVIDELGRPGVFDNMVKITEELKNGIREIITGENIDVQVEGIGANFNIFFTSQKILDYRSTLSADLKAREMLDYSLINRGIYYHPNKALYTSTAHTAEDVEQTLETLKSLDFKEIKSKVGI